jgi:GTP-binding protein
MSDHWENVTDNVEALLDMVLANVPALKFQEGTPHVDYVIRLSAFGRIAIGRLERGVLKKVCQSLVEMSSITNLGLRNHTFEGLGRKKYK